RARRSGPRGQARPPRSNPLPLCQQVPQVPAHPRLRCGARVEAKRASSTADIRASPARVVDQIVSLTCGGPAQPDVAYRELARRANEELGEGRHAELWSVHSDIEDRQGARGVRGRLQVATDAISDVAEGAGGRAVGVELDLLPPQDGTGEVRRRPAVVERHPRSVVVE